MLDLDDSTAGVPVREDLQEAHRFAWNHVRSAGTWWTGAERVAIAAAVRAAAQCPLCRERKAALAPNAVRGAHAGAADLPAHVVDVIHRIRTDPARLSRAWFESVIAAGLREEAYVELVGVVTQVTGIDFFCRALGTEPHPLPAPLPGAPSRRRPAAAKSGTAWVAMIAPEDAAGLEVDLYPRAPRIPNIMRALSLVPDEVRALRRTSDARYLPVGQILDASVRRPTIDRMQMELVAARVSALNQCFY